MTEAFGSFWAGASASPPPRPAVERHQELQIESLSAQIDELAKATTDFMAEVSDLPEAPKFKGRVSRARQTFEHFDADGSGVIDYAEVEVGLRALLAKWGSCPTHADVDTLRGRCRGFCAMEWPLKWNDIDD